MASVALILASHGRMAEEILKSAQMIAGRNIENAATVSVVEGMDYEAALKEMDAKFEQLDHSLGTVIITDIYGGTPANVATSVLLKHENVYVFSGLNLPILLEILFQRSTTAKNVAEMIEQQMSSVMVNIKTKLKEVSYGDQEDSY